MKKGTLFLITLFSLSCTSHRSFFPKDLPKCEVQVVRFDSALLNIDTTNISAYVRQLYTDYSSFMPTFCQDILGIDIEDTTYLTQALPLFLNDTLYGFKQTNQKAKEVFDDITSIKKELNIAFARILYLYPQTRIPDIMFFVSGFNASILFYNPNPDNYLEEDIAVGVDMYLGSDWEYYNQVVYNYQKQTMRKECIPADVVSAWLFRNIPFESKKNRLIDNMIYRGKIMYLLSLLLPMETEAEVMGYSKQQWQWAKKYEAAIWKLMLDKQDIYKTDSPVLTSYLNDGPFTAEISQESPPRLGTYIGWQIAKSYIENNKSVTLTQLLEENDAQKILEKSHYKP